MACGEVFCLRIYKIRPLKITLRMFMYGLDAKIMEILELLGIEKIFREQKPHMDDSSQFLILRCMERCTHTFP